MSIVEKYINNGEVQRAKIALDTADGTILKPDIREICSDQRIKDAFIGESYNKKQPKETWDAAYLDRIVCAAPAENFNLDYLLYLAEVSAYVRSKEASTNAKKIAGIVVAVAIVVVIAGVVIWKIGHIG
ncbi:MAG: hypothetical protein ACOX8M_13460 [Marvinbryantia sp.]|jgi:hypothetical protein